MRESGETAGRVPVSVLVITRNEEANISQCLESVRWAAEVGVVDSFSTDRTVEIAKSLGARVYQHAFKGYTAQRNWALDNLPFAHEWILVLDADERISRALASEISRAVGQPNGKYAGFYLNRRLFFLGRRLRYGGLSPIWILRLFKRSSGRFEYREVNEHVILNGPAGYLRAPFDHCDQRSLADWIQKHNRYAGLEAEEYLRDRFGTSQQSSIPARFWGSQAERKRWIKFNLWNGVPLLIRPFLFFFRNYLLKGGFLDGQPGFLYHVFWSFWYPFLIDAKIIEAKLTGRAPSSP
jgi:glycosyltransferase involved in cell wall biosynthesis